MSFLFLVETLQTGFLMVGSLALLIDAGSNADVVTAATDMMNSRLPLVTFSPGRFCMVLRLPFDTRGMDAKPGIRLLRTERARVDKAQIMV